MRFNYAVSLLLLVAACDKAEPTPAPVSTPAEKPAEPVETTEKPSAPTPQERLAESEVRAVFDQWLKAQNDSDFAAYEATYARKFEGIKRVGAKTSKFDRDGWVKDRARMFKKKMNVTADEVKIATSGKTAVVTFTQTWESGTFKDVGPKQLVIAQDASGLRIAREEMMSSTVVGAASNAAPYNPDQAASVIEKGQFVVLKPSAGDLGVGPIRPESRAYSATRAVDPAKWPQAKTWDGRKMEVYGPSGKVCDTTVESVEILTRAYPHFGDVGHWDSEKRSDAYVAEQIWGLAGDQALVVARLADAKKCASGVWAKPAGSAATPIAEVKIDGDLRAKVKKQFQALPGYAAILGEFKGDGGEGDVWYDDSLFEIRRFGDYATVYAQGGMGCGQFYGEIWAIFEIRGDDLVVLSDPRNPGHLIRPAAAPDTDGDGKPEFFGDRAIATPVGTVWRVTQPLDVPYFDCPC